MTDIPSRWHYVAGVAVLIIGIILFVVFLVTGIIGSVPEIRFVVPGTHEIYLEKTGEYIVFYEYRSVINHKVYSTGESFSGMLATLESKEDSREVELSRPSVNSSYEVGGRAGISVLQFEIEEPGAYIFAADYDNAANGPDVVFAIGQFGLLGVFFKFFGSLVGGLIIGGVIIIRAYLKRSEASKTKKPTLS